MKFLAKDPAAESQRLRVSYRTTTPARNRKIKQLLIYEQYGFCAYSEKVIDTLDSVEVEHFNPALKDHDDTSNYYAVIRYVNQHKQHLYTKFKNSPFFSNRFFQTPALLAERIQYVLDGFGGGFYQPCDPEDSDAQNLIDFLGWNAYELSEARRKHLKKIRVWFRDAGYDSTEKILEHFREFPENLSYITMLEQAFHLDLTTLLAEIQSHMQKPGD